MQVLDAKQMRAADEAAIAAGIPSSLLMENAAFAVLRELERSIPQLRSQRIAIYCGKGNNGGDGLALARLLAVHVAPLQISVVLPFPPDQLSPDAGLQFKMLHLLGIKILPTPTPELAGSTLAIDALLGTGSSGVPSGVIAECLDSFNALPQARKWAMDIPTGLGTPKFAQVEKTVTFAALKLGLAYGPSADQCGEVLVRDIGIPPQFLQSSIFQTEIADFSLLLQHRQRDSHKGTFGHVGLFGGGNGKWGALQLAGRAALRSGAGLVTSFSPDPGFRAGQPELMKGTWPRSPEELPVLSVYAVGPGLGNSPQVIPWLQEWVGQESKPMVLDADALNLLSPWVRKMPPGVLRVLTPHPKEMERLLGRPIVDRLADAQHLAQEFNVVLILKGHRSVIAFPDGTLWLNPTGSPAMAKGGSGDALTGILAALLAQHPNCVKECVVAGVYLHGLCGEIAGRKLHERSVLASELIDSLPEAFRAVS